MPHVTAYVAEPLLDGREADLIAGFTDAIVGVYGEWAREVVTVLLVGVPERRWGRGGQAAARPAPLVVFGIREAAFARPDAADIVAGLTSGITGVIATVCGPEMGRSAEIELVGTPAGRTAVGGTLVD